MTDFPRRILFQTAAGVALGTFATATEAEAGTLLYVVAGLVSKPETADKLRALLVPLAKTSARQHGYLHYSLLEDNKQPGSFLTYETWTGMEALNGHMKLKAVQDLVPQLADLLAQPFTQTFLTKLTG